MAYHKCYLIFIFVISFVSITNASEKKNYLPPQCEGESCLFRSKTEQWPAPIEQPTIQINIGMFIVNIPSNITYLSVLPEAPLVAQYETYRLGVSLEMEESLGILDIERPFEKSIYRFIDYPKLIFTKTIRDPEPEKYIDRLILRIAMREKGVRFKDTKKGTIFKNGKVTAYMARTNFVGFTGDLILTHEDFPNHYLRVIDKNAELKIIEGIISSFKINPDYQ